MATTLRMEEDWLLEACNAASHGDHARICACFGCDTNHISTGLDGSLVSSPTRALQVLDFLFGSRSTQITSPNIQLQLVFRAVLMIPSSYETPWQAVCDVVQKSMHQGVGCLGSKISAEDRLLLILVTEIQSFFHQTVTAWWELERRPTTGRVNQNKTAATEAQKITNATPRQMLTRLAEIIMSPLISPTSIALSARNVRDFSRWNLPLGLLTTMVSLFRYLDDDPGDCSSVIPTILGLVLHDGLQPECLLPWMTIVVDLCGDLRAFDWNRLRVLLFRAITSQNPESLTIDVSDLPGLAKAIVTLVSTNDKKGGIIYEEMQSIWQQLILHLLKLASSNDATFSTLETVLQSSFATLHPSLLQKWLPGDTVCNKSDETANIPGWIKVHLILLISQAYSQSGSRLISHLVANALGHDGEDEHDVATLCWVKLVTLAVPNHYLDDLSKHHRSRRRLGSHAVVQELERIFDEVLYCPQEHLVRRMPDGSEKSIPFLTHAAVLVRESLFLGSVANRAQRPSYHIFFAERAQWWVNVAKSAVLQAQRMDQRGASLFDVVIAIVVIVVVYCEIPSSRATVVRSAIRSFTIDQSNQGTATSKQSYCTIISIIVRSLTRNHNALSAAGLGALHPITDVFAKVISKSNFCSLAIALAPLPPARSSLLTFARKSLHSSRSTYDHHLWLEDGSSSDRCERIECAFYALCVIFESLDDECGLEAWKMLSDLIVLRHPPLPCAARSVLYKCLEIFIGKKRFNVSCCMHLLRACLLTLCTYCVDWDGHLEIAPERAFSTWTGSKPGAKARIVQREDLVSLLKLAINLLRVTTLDDKKQFNAAKLERESILNNVLALRSNEVAECFSLAKLEDKDTVATGGTMCLIDSLLRNITNPNSTETTDEREESICTHLMTKLVEAERDKLDSLSVDWTDENQVPSWLREASSFDAIRPQGITVDPSFLVSIQVSFCDLLLEVVINWNWPFRASSTEEAIWEDSLRRNAIASSFILSQKRKRISTLKGFGQISSSAFDIETFGGVSRLCLKYSEQLLKSTTYGFQTITDIEAALELAFEACNAIDEVKPEDEAQCCGLSSDFLFPSVWELYMAVGTEEQAVLFIGFLDKVCSQQNSPSTKATICFSRVRTTNDVDDIIRRLRTFTLRALLRCISWACPGEATPELGDETERATSTNQGLEIDLLSTVLVTLCRDLRVGLDGKSGGMTNHLYLAYIDCIEGVVSLMHGLSKVSYEKDGYHTALAACRHGSLFLEQAVCSFPLRAAALFKKTLKLSFISLPSLARVICQQQANFADSIFEGGDEGWTAYGFPNTVFGQCMDLFARWAAKGLDSTTPWIEIAGSEHCSSPPPEDSAWSVAESSPYPLSTLSSEDMPAIIASRSSDPMNQTTAATKSQAIGSKIQLPVKACWSWACIFAISAMEENWIESLKVMVRKRIIDQSASTRNGWVSYLALRREELGSIFHTIRLAFQQCKNVSENCLKSESSSKEGGFEVFLVLLLPGAIKLRLCALLGRISLVLLRSVKVIQQYLRGSLDKHGSTALNVGVVEALGCLCAWLCDNSDESDFTSFIRRWYTAEKTLHDVTHNLSGGDDFLLRRFRKLIYRLGEHESALKSLHEAFSSLKESDTQNKGIAMEELLKSSLGPSWDFVSDENCFDIRSLISAKIKAVSDNLERNDSLGAELSGRRKRRREAHWVHRNNVSRSRNPVVDSWLQLDQEIEDDADDDAYVELEDFLVDG